MTEKIQKILRFLTQKVRSLFYLLFVKHFWEGLGATVIFLLMIPAIQSERLPWWMAILGAIIMGLASRLFSESYNSTNPFRGIFNRKKN